MIKSLFSKLDNRVYMIHCEKRRDRRRLVDTWTEAEGVRVNLFPAIIMPDGRQGCAASHKALAQLLKTQNANGYHLILEDDAVPRPTAYENLAEVYEAMDSNEFDILWLGNLPMPSSQNTRWHSIRRGSAWTTHAILVNQRALDFLATFEWKGTPIDVELAQAPLRGAWVHPEVFAQARGPSNVRSTSFTRMDAFGELMQLYTPLWRKVVYHKTTLCLFAAALLLAFLIQHVQS